MSPQNGGHPLASVPNVVPLPQGTLATYAAPAVPVTLTTLSTKFVVLLRNTGTDDLGYIIILCFYLACANPVQTPSALIRHRASYPTLRETPFRTNDIDRLGAFPGPAYRGPISYNDASTVNNSIEMMVQSSC